MGTDVLYIAIVLIVILFSMTLHEVMHGFVAYWLGDDTAKSQGRLTLNPINHIDPFLTILLPILLALSGGPIFGGAKPVPFDPARVKYDEWGAALVAVAGPLTNFFIAFITFGIWVFIGMPDAGLVGQFFRSAIIVNLGFFIFNSIPIPPLDGSRVLYALAPDFVREAMEVVERYGLILVFLIIVLAGTALGTFMVGAITFFYSFFIQIYGIA